MASVITSVGKGSLITQAEHDSNLDIMTGLNVLDANDITITDAHQNATVEMTSASAKDVTLTLLSTIIAAIDTTDFQFTIYNSGAGTCTITCNGSDSINGGTGASTVVLLVDESVTFQSANVATEWNVLAPGFNLATRTGNNTFSGIQTFSGTIAGATPFVLEGSTVDGNELSIVVTDPTADRTQTHPDASGEFVINNGGAIVQSKFTEDTNNRSSTNNSYATMTSAITLDNDLQKSTHKVKITVNGVIGHSGTANAVCGLTLYDGSSTVHNAAVGGLCMASADNSSPSTWTDNFNFTFVDSPGTVTPKTYTVYGKVSAGTIYLGRRGSDTLIDTPVLLTIEEIIAL